MTHQRPKTDGVGGSGASPLCVRVDMSSVSGQPIGITDLTDAATKSMTDPSMEELARQMQQHLTAEQIYLGNAKAERWKAEELKEQLDAKFTVLKNANNVVLEGGNHD